MITVNQRIFNEIVKRQIYLERYKAGLVYKLSPVLRMAIADINAKIMKVGTETSRARLNLLLKEVTEINRDASAEVYGELLKEMQRLAKVETKWTGAQLQATFPQAVGITVGLPSATFLTRMVETQPFQGLVLKEWSERIGMSASLKARQQLFIGIAEGESLDKIQKRFNFIGEQSKNDLSMVVRTSVNAITNQAKDAVYQENSDVIKSVMWRSTLDGRTSEICQARDGMEWDVNEDHPTPPAHPNCRSVIVPVIKSLAELGLSGIKLPEGTRASMNGQVPAGLNYNDWLAQQPREFIDEVLGPTRAQAFVGGDLTLDKFVDDIGHRLTLAELEAKYPNAF